MMKIDDISLVSTWHNHKGEIDSIKYGHNFEVTALPYIIPHLKIAFTLSWTSEKDIPEIVPAHIIDPEENFLFDLSQVPQKHSLKHSASFDFRPFRFEIPGIYKVVFSHFPSQNVSTDTQVWIQIHLKA